MSLQFDNCFMGPLMKSTDRTLSIKFVKFYPSFSLRSFSRERLNVSNVYGIKPSYNLLVFSSPNITTLNFNLWKQKILVEQRLIIRSSWFLMGIYILVFNIFHSKILLKLKNFFLLVLCYLRLFQTLALATSGCSFLRLVS